MPKYNCDIEVVKTICCGTVIKASSKEKAEEILLQLYDDDELDEYVISSGDKKITITKVE